MAIEISRAVRFLAVLFTGLALVPSGAHLLELANKMKLPPDSYMMTQSIYAGWALLGIVVLLAFIFTLWLTLVERGRGASFWLALAAFLCIAGTQVIFWTLTYPMNALTANWTKMPPDLEGARVQWEYSHAASALLNFVAFVCTALAAVTDRQPA
jgi:hypothetical protein